MTQAASASLADGAPDSNVLYDATLLFFGGLMGAFALYLFDFGGGIGVLKAPAVMSST